MNFNIPPGQKIEVSTGESRERALKQRIAELEAENDQLRRRAEYWEQAAGYLEKGLPIPEPPHISVRFIAPVDMPKQ